MTTVADLAREYLRVSQDKSGKLESPAEQHDENAEHAARNGWELGDPYAEPEAVSASRYSDKARDEFARLVADLAGGRFGAGILILWESSRGSRQVGEWVGLIGACETARVLIYVTTHGRSYNPANARDRKSLLEDAIASEYASAETRERVLRSTAARARKGQPHGRIAYGYTRTYDQANRKLFTQDPHPGESPNVAELYRRIHAGDTLSAIERDWAARGIVSRSGRRIDHRDLRRMALNPVYAGLRVRQPKGTVRRPGSVDGAVEAAWPAIVDREAYYAVRDLLTDPGRRTSRPGRGKHLLSMIAECGECGSTLSVWYRDGARYYACREKGCVFVAADDLDAVAVPLIIGYLSQPETARVLQPSADGLPELGKVRADLAKARDALRKWVRDAGLLKVSPEAFGEIEPVIRAEIGRLAERERVLTVPPELDGWTGPAEQVAKRWEASGVPARRGVARAVLSRHRMGVLQVVRVGGRGRLPMVAVPVAERVSLDRT
jgi:site-specific DNA recombinase